MSEFYCKPQSFDDPVLKKMGIRLNKNSVIDFKNFTIGRNSKINGILHVKGGKITLGQFIAGGYDIKLIANNHNVSLINMQVTLQRYIHKNHGIKTALTKSGFINIGNAVWLGDNCMVMKNVTIGDGAVIGGGGRDKRRSSLCYSCRCSCKSDTI